MRKLRANFVVHAQHSCQPMTLWIFVLFFFLIFLCVIFIIFAVCFDVFCFVYCLIWYETKKKKKKASMTCPIKTVVVYRKIRAVNLFWQRQNIRKTHWVMWFDEFHEISSQFFYANYSISSAKLKWTVVESHLLL